MSSGQRASGKLGESDDNGQGAVGVDLLISFHAYPGRDACTNSVSLSSAFAEGKAGGI